MPLITSLPELPKSTKMPLPCVVLTFALGLLLIGAMSESPFLPSSSHYLGNVS